ncbi:MAG: FHA domain-containing protein [Candidatus Dadabacteria bacterium]|nr:FHA domain-containing protein [Candidatus Dadabacteria bacterium]NIS08239.1 FHA domain-containing protein [Candidatus Dadabacteria bacterium]NIV41506.1 FHA domain-containing protein [Candidatus Dadabacteria bacterium]NIY21727.1 FHA domain-containing protein [Candidatus Dadabacteria bacterium]
MGELLLVVSFGTNVVESWRIDKDRITIGRDDTNDIVLNNPTISRQHAEISVSNGLVSIKDLGSSNGTYINNVKMDEVTLDVGDEIIVGKYMIKVKSANSLDPALDLSFQSAEEGKSTDVETFRADTKARKEMLEKYQTGENITFPLLIFPNNKEVKITENNFFIGKGSQSDLRIKGRFIKDVHAKIIKVGAASYKLISFGSLFSPVKVNGKKIKEKILRHGDVIEIGGEEIVFNQ